MKRVYVPQQAMRRVGTEPDGVTPTWQPAVDLTPAMEFGDLEVLLPPAPLGPDAQAMLQALWRRLRDKFDEHDYVVATGDPAAIAATAIIAAYQNEGRVKLLRWDRVARQYMCVQIDADAGFNS